MPPCLICQTATVPIMDFGRMPIANGFLTPDEFASESFHNLRVGFCPACHMVQLTEQVDREKMFHDHYAFFSSTSRRMAAHFERLAAEAKELLTGRSDPFVVEIGSNDGVLLRHFSQAGIRHLGIEPSTNVAAVACEQGIRTISRFFDANLARELHQEHGGADLFFGANVMCHIPDIHSVAEGIRILLNPEGRLIFEDPYLGDIVDKTSYDQIYDEHVFYFSVLSVQRLFEKHGLEVVDVQRQDVHGGSMRYVLGHRGAHPVAATVGAQRNRELVQGLDRPETFAAFRARVERSRERLMEELGRLRREGKRVAGYAATSKSTTVTNYCGITPDLVEYISDTTPIKQGKYSPGVHLPVRPHEAFCADYPDVALLFGWNHAGEIMANEQAFQDAGGRWLVYVPEVKILS
ncbi:MAG: class I SAM-dependent methyltransferase [Kiritimatiellia bacterium]|nr:class I SAM-dependent methyltransferase [Kiritimatiellia bacterium]